MLKDLKSKEVKYEYESLKITYTLDCTYTPDVVLPNGIIVELKGFFRGSDRRKHLQLRTQYPHLDIRFVFQDANKKISKTSKTTYGMWASKNGITFAEGYIPDSWLSEPLRALPNVAKKIINAKRR